MTQRDRLRQLIIDFCNERQVRTFSLRELSRKYKNYEDIGIGGKTPESTVRRLLQQLRDSGSVIFHDRHGKRGHYTFCDKVLLDYEMVSVDGQDCKLSPMKSHAKEYLFEIFGRRRRLVEKAQIVLGPECMYKRCRNTFNDPENEPYTEVHHIRPLCRGGADAIWNLSVLCGHHHKQAHFAHQQERDDLEKYLLGAVRERL
ncbi:MAG: HNH endonuclease [Gammaproteobacteria bacterium AqS3]|nr:HNH endonuclease [Gammaproteobacteria bacterium AqS3]